MTLFEGGRVAGQALVSELTSELWASHAEGQAFEGDMARLAQVSAGGVGWASHAEVHVLGQEDVARLPWASLQVHG